METKQDTPLVIDIDVARAIIDNMNQRLDYLEAEVDMLKSISYERLTRILTILDEMENVINVVKAKVL